jgi:hypothetical protein
MDLGLHRPYFADNDPEMYGGAPPVAFWKVIAFIHDRTGGYARQATR